MSIIELSQLGHIYLILVIWNVFKQNKLKLYEISHLTWPHPLTHTPSNRWGCLNKSNIFKQNWIISIRSRFIRYLAIWPDPIHWPTEPPIHTTIHAPTHGWGCLFQIINLQTVLNYLDYVKIYSILSHLPWPHPLTHWPTQPSTHPPMGGGVSTNHKSLNRIELFQLDQDLFNC